MPAKKPKKSERKQSIFRTSTLGQQSQSTPKRYYGQVGNNRQGNLR